MKKITQDGLEIIVGMTVWSPSPRGASVVQGRIESDPNGMGMKIAWLGQARNVVAYNYNFSSCFADMARAYEIACNNLREANRHADEAREIRQEIADLDKPHSPRRTEIESLHTITQELADEYIAVRRAEHSLVNLAEEVLESLEHLDKKSNTDWVDEMDWAEHVYQPMSAMEKFTHCKSEIQRIQKCSFGKSVYLFLRRKTETAGVK